MSPVLAAAVEAPVDVINPVPPPGSLWLPGSVLLGGAGLRRRFGNEIAVEMRCASTFA
jgi:hypothetical protein